MTNTTSTVVLIPVHNEAPTIRNIVLESLTHAGRVIVIDDGSTDETYGMLAGCGAEVIHNSVNVGKGRRLLEGLQYAFSGGASRVITIDGDGQHDPGDIPKFLACSDSNPSAMILGDRSQDTGNMPFSRAFGNHFGSFFISWACARKLRDAQCGMRLYPARIWKEVRIPPAEVDGFLFETAILLHASETDTPFISVPIAARYGGFVHRPSYFQPIRDFLKIARMVTRYLFKRQLRLRGLVIASQLVNETKDNPKGGAKKCKR